MVQRDHGGQAALVQAAQHETVALEGLLIPLVRLGLDAAPFDGEAVGVVVRFGGAVEILTPAAAPPVAGQAGGAGGVALLLPFPPLIVGIVAFHLMGTVAVPHVPGSGRWRLAKESVIYE
jgi:hypothetical protein